MEHSKAHDAVTWESRAVAHKIRGEFAQARAAYLKAAALWGEKADRAARYGETAISDIFRNEQRSNARRADAMIWESVA